MKDYRYFSLTLLYVVETSLLKTIKAFLTKPFTAIVESKKLTKQWIDENVPVILRMGYDAHNGHWIVAVGYALNEKNELTDILTLDPGNGSPKYCLWNGILNINKEHRKKYGYHYNTDRLYLVDVDEAIIITRNK